MAETTVLFILSIAVPSIFRDCFWAHFGLGLGFWGFFLYKGPDLDQSWNGPWAGVMLRQVIGGIIHLKPRSQDPMLQLPALEHMPSVLQGPASAQWGCYCSSLSSGNTSTHLKLSFCKLSATGPYARQTHMVANGNRTQPGSRAA